MTPSKIWKIKKIDAAQHGMNPGHQEQTTDKKMLKNVNGVVKQNRFLCWPLYVNGWFYQIVES